MDGGHDPGTVSPLAIPAIVTFPAELDVTNADRVTSELQAAFGPGVTVVIGDLSGTQFCDSSGARCLLQARDTAAARQAGLRLVIPAGAVLRMLTLAGFDQLLQLYPTLQLALADDSSATADRDARNIVSWRRSGPASAGMVRRRDERHYQPAQRHRVASGPDAALAARSASARAAAAGRVLARRG
jgi:anti-sigma B factor antagonist